MKFEKYESLFRTVSNSFNFQECFKGEKHFNILNYKLCFLWCLWHCLSFFTPFCTCFHFWWWLNVFGQLAWHISNRDLFRSSMIVLCSFTFLTNSTASRTIFVKRAAKASNTPKLSNRIIYNIILYLR